ncbi:MAG: carbohydrate ABC transporter permease [Oscillospiraceae bacterium]|jgi:arabinosaccharide transport system permease protein|nr:carbohydrate ABC transporter permease [Oscillospiraceae bacterium]
MIVKAHAAPKAGKSKLGYSRIARVFLVLFFGAIALFVLIPLVAMVLGTFKGGAELWRNGLNLSPEFEMWSLKSWRYLFTGITIEGEYLPHNYFTWFFNSMFITVLQTVLTLLISAFVAYGFAMYEFKGKNLLFLCVLIVMMIPFEILMLPMYVQANAMHLLNSIWGIMLPFLASVSTIFFFRQYLTGIPKDLLDAGRVDGCNEYAIFFRIVLPIMKPAMSSMAVLTGMGAWNALLWPMLVLTSMDKYTLPIGLNTLFSPYGNNYDLMICGSCFAVLPILLLYTFAQKFIIEGMTAGSVKG